MYSAERKWMPKNGTGFGVALLSEYLTGKVPAAAKSQ
jgi:hypothetical protein